MGFGGGHRDIRKSAKRERQLRFGRPRHFLDTFWCQKVSRRQAETTLNKNQKLKRKLTLNYTAPLSFSKN